MSLFEKLFGSNKSEREVGGKPDQVSTEALPREQYEEDLPIAKEYDPDEDLPMATPVEEKPASSAAAFRAMGFNESRTAKEIRGENIVDFNDYKKQKEEKEAEKIQSVKLLIDFIKTAKENNITDPFALGELAANQSDIDRINLERAAELIADKKDQKELLETAGVPEADRDELVEVASKIILMSKVKTRETLKHLG
ncbi:MAG: hypothetical protein BWY53_00678 [Parcubacteria group bacterium ADurb.Bin326]|nr:MAG: hypothetical protein BWY53_00678 [Parcubacteria group bacterium ADurb.Bin326]